MKITYIKTIGFRKFENEFETELFDITSITGGNAKGKTNILYAIVWGFLGCNLTGDDKVYIGNKNADNCYVELHFIDNMGISHTLKRLKNKYNNKKNLLLLDEKNISQEDLTSYYSDKKLFLSIVNSNYFISRSTADQKALLDKYLPEIDINEIYNKLDDEDKSILEGCPRNVIQYIQELNDNKKIYEDKIKNLQGKIAYAENYISEKLDSSKTFDKQEELSLAMQELSFLKSDQKVEARKRQQKIVDNLNSQIITYQNQIDILNTNMIDGKKTYISIKNEPVSYCPMCKQKLSDEGRLVTIKNMKDSLENDYSKKIKLETELQELKRNLAVEKCKLYALGNENLDDQNNRTKELENQIKLLEQEKSEIDQYNTSINIKKENIQKAKDDIQIFKKNIDDLYDNIDSNKKAKDVAQKLLINYIEAKMQFATKHLKNVNIKYYTILKDSGEIKQDFIITYKGNDFKNLSRSETIATSLEISNMLNKISGVKLPLFIDDSESCADYDFIEDFSNDNQIFIAKVEKGKSLEIADYSCNNAQFIKAA
jgi:DNA repair exonuclease SbcCD ATPase subunit